MKKTKFFALLLALLMLLSSLTFTVSADVESAREALQQKIEQAENAYPPPGSNPVNGTVAALSDAIDEAIKVLTDSTSTEEELLAQISLLDTAINGIIILQLDNSKLWAAMELANSLNAEDYTEESFEAMRALANNYFILHYAQSQQEIDDATNKLYLAILSLVPVGTATVPYIDEELYSTARERLFNALCAAEEQLSQVGGNYNNETYSVLVETFERALTIYESGEELTDDEYIALAEELEAAIEGIEYFHWDTDELWAVIESCESLYEDIENGKYFYDTFLDNYREESNNARMALYYGQSQEEVDNAAKQLKEAARRLIPQDDIRGELEEEVKLTEENILPNENLYTKDSFEQVVLMYQYSKSLLTENPQEATMMQAIYDLREAKDRLSLKQDTPSSSEATTTSVTEATEVVTATAVNTDPTEVTTIPATTAVTEPVETTATIETSEITEATEATTTTATAEATTATADETTAPATTETAETTEATTTEEVIPTVKPNPNYMIGDADGNSKINIKDATTIQKHLAKLITLSDAEFVAGDANEDGKLNVKDATEIQKHLANLPSNNHIGMEIVTPDTNPVETTVIAVVTETVSETGTMPSSEAATTATKDEETTIVTTPATTVVTEPSDATDATEATTVTATNTETTTETVPATEETTTEVQESEPITIYFRDDNNWGNIYIYYWNKYTNEQVNWPGIPMELVEKSTDGNIYQAEIPASATGIVFSSQSIEIHQTRDITEFKNGDGFYPTELKGINWDVSPLFLKKDFPIDCQTMKNERIYEGYGSESNFIYLVKNDSDKIYENLFDCEFPEVDTEDLANRGKAAIVILTFIGSGDSTLRIDRVTVEGNELFVMGTIAAPMMGTADMNYRFVVIETDLSNVEGVDKCFYSAVKNYV